MEALIFRWLVKPFIEILLDTVIGWKGDDNGQFSSMGLLLSPKILEKILGKLLDSMLEVMNGELGLMFIHECN